MLSANKLVHYKAGGPNVDGLAVCDFPEHLLGRLIHKCATSVIEAMLQLHLDCQAEIDYFHRSKVARVRDHHIGGLEVSMHKVEGVNVL